MTESGNNKNAVNGACGTSELHSVNELGRYLYDILAAGAKQTIDPMLFSDENRGLCCSLNSFNVWMGEFRRFISDAQSGKTDLGRFSDDNPLKNEAAAISTVFSELNHVKEELDRENNRLAAKEETLKESNELLSCLTDNTKDWIVITQVGTGDILFMNYAARDFLECSPKLTEHLKRAMSKYDGVYSCRVWEIDCPPDAVEVPYTITFQIQSQNTEWRNRKAVMHIIVDITEQRQYSQMMEQYAFSDVNTGLYNRRYCVQQMENLLMEKREFAICFIDIDNLKHVNDTWGHVEGDVYIKAVADSIKNAFRKSDTACRIGGDEFVVLMPGAEEKHATTRMELMMEILGKHEKSEEYSMAVSYGVLGVESGTTQQPERILSIVDARMYQQKSAKRKKKAKAILESIPN